MNDKTPHDPLIPSRRTVLRTAAWTVPAVTVATAAPAFATSSVTGSLGITQFSGNLSRTQDWVQISGLRIVNNTSVALPAMSYTVTFTMDARWGVTGAYYPGTAIAPQPAGYTSGVSPLVLTLEAPAINVGDTQQLLPGATDLRWYMTDIPLIAAGERIQVRVKPASGYAQVASAVEDDPVVGSAWL